MWDEVSTLFHGMNEKSQKVTFKSGNPSIATVNEHFCVCLNLLQDKH